jgi:hypothetical protein
MKECLINALNEKKEKNEKNMNNNNEFECGIDGCFIKK